jgi:hypothetical protein
MGRPCAGQLARDNPVHRALGAPLKPAATLKLNVRNGSEAARLAGSFPLKNLGYAVRIAPVAA